MSSPPRALPDHPSLRFLKLEAKRRCAAGEFSALHHAQAAIARDHGLPDWAALKLYIADAQQPSHALSQLRWLLSRFSAAGRPGWTAPDDAEMRAHFADSFLAAIPAERLIKGATRLAAGLRGELTVLGQVPLQARVRIAELEYIAQVEPDPPHRVIFLRGYPLGGRITDPRVTQSPSRGAGDVPAEMAAIADAAFAELGLAGLITAGQNWVLARGWADLDRGEIMEPGQQFPATGVTAAVTVTAVLRMVADGRLSLDGRAGDYLTTVRLADETITLRELLTHTAGIDEPRPMMVPAALDLVAAMGPVIGCGGPRGVCRPSNGGLAVLGQIVADMSGSTFAVAASRLVLDPLGMTYSTFPAARRPEMVTGYEPTVEGVFESVPPLVPLLHAAGGLWSTAADLLRLAAGWRRLLPADLARQALTAHASVGAQPAEVAMGLGWLLLPGRGIAVAAGAVPGFTTCLLTGTRAEHLHLTFTNRLIPLDRITQPVQRLWGA
jgi:CubicO group peptidase (beta-lactamase class C family)